MYKCGLKFVSKRLSFALLLFLLLPLLAGLVEVEIEQGPREQPDQKDSPRPDHGGRMRLG